MDKYGTKQLHSTVQENNLQLLSIPDPIESYCIYIYIYSSLLHDTKMGLEFMTPVS